MPLFTRPPVTLPGSSGDGNTDTTAAGQAVRVIIVGGFSLDAGFLDALYTGGKINGSQRDAILAGNDPSGFGLSQYDLWVLTVGRLGGKTTVTGIAGIKAWDSSVAYASGTIVLFQPPGCQRNAMYQAGTTGGGPAATLPTNATYWAALTDPGPVVLLDTDVTSPTITALVAPGSTIEGGSVTAGAALPAMTVPAGKRYRVWTSDPRPSTVGAVPATDHAAKMDATCAETLNADGSVTLTITPRWMVMATALNTAVVVVAANFYTSHIRVELQ